MTRDQESENPVSGFADGPVQSITKYPSMTTCEAFLFLKDDMSYIPQSAFRFLEKAPLVTFSNHGSHHACHIPSTGIQGEGQVCFGDDFGNLHLLPSMLIKYGT